MAHNIGRMFYFGDQPWHELGTELDQPANLTEALKAGGLDWEVETVPIVPAGEPDSGISHRVAVVRKDRKPGEVGRVIGVVYPGFRPLQNREGAQIFDSLLGQGGRIYHTGGYLRNGEVIWLLAKLSEDIRVRSNDVLETYLLFSNSHDGSLAIDIRLTTVRVVCQNTLSMALDKNALGKVFRRAHDGRYELLKEEAKTFFEFTTSQSRKAQALFARLASQTCEKSAFETFLKNLMRVPSKPASQNQAVLRGYETRMQKVLAARKEVMGVHEHGIEQPRLKIPPAEPTWWGALNTITAWVDHVQETDNDRYAHILMGGGDRLKATALKHIQATVAKPAGAS